MIELRAAAFPKTLISIRVSYITVCTPLPSSCLHSCVLLRVLQFATHRAIEICSDLSDPAALLRCSNVRSKPVLPRLSVTLDMYDWKMGNLRFCMYGLSQYWLVSCSMSWVRELLNYWRQNVDHCLVRIFVQSLVLAPGTDYRTIMKFLPGTQFRRGWSYALALRTGVWSGYLQRIRAMLVLRYMIRFRRFHAHYPSNGQRRLLTPKWCFIATVHYQLQVLTAKLYFWNAARFLSAQNGQAELRLTRSLMKKDRVSLTASPTPRWAVPHSVLEKDVSSVLLDTSNACYHVVH